MAEDFEKKPKGGGSGGFKIGGLTLVDDIEIIIGLAILVFIVRAIYMRIYDLFSGNLSSSSAFANWFQSFIALAIPFGKVLSVAISIACILAAIYLTRKIGAIRATERAIFYPPVKSPAEAIKNRKWERITDHINSPNLNDWKLAILEADIILDEMLDSMGYRGATMGDKLKLIEKSDFTTIDSAWEAHKVRNSIAHEGSDFLITEREAKRVIALYESIFKEFNYI